MSILGVCTSSWLRFYFELNSSLFTKLYAMIGGLGLASCSTTTYMWFFWVGGWTSGVNKEIFKEFIPLILLSFCVELSFYKNF